MRYGVLFLLTGLALVALAFRLGGFGWLLLWPAFSLVLVAFSYLRHDVRLYGKRDDGSVSIVSTALLLPYILLLRCVWHLYRHTSNEAPYHHLVTNIWIGRRLLAHEYPDDIDLVIDLTCEFPGTVSTDMELQYISRPILDADTPSMEGVDAVIEQIEQCAGNVYIHCAQGHGRTGLIAAFLLLAREEVDAPEEAIAYLQRKRPRLRLNRKQIQFLSKVAG